MNMGVPSMQDAKGDIYSALIGMGYTPTNLLITELDTNTDDGFWQINGEFKGGFLGETLKFEIKYNQTIRTFVKCKVYPITPPDYA
jgi:hypothetical protein